MYTVVIVDDEPWALQGLAEIIDWNNEGFSIIGQFTDPDEAFEFLCKKEPDVVFTDIRMPGLSGLDLIEMSRVKGLNCEFVLISSYEDFEAAQKGIRLHVWEYILKPYNAEDIHSVTKILSLHLEKRNDLVSVEWNDCAEEILRKAGSLQDQLKNYQTMVLYICSRPCEEPEVLREEKWIPFVVKDTGGAYLRVSAESHMSRLNLPQEDNQKWGVSREHKSGVNSLPQMLQEAWYALWAGFSYSGSEKVGEIQFYLCKNMNEEFSLKSVAEKYHFSEPYFCTLFKKGTGMSVIHMEDGYRYLRCQMGTYGGQMGKGKQRVISPENSKPGAYYDPNQYCAGVVKLFSHLRDKLGYEVELLHDIHERLTPAQAIGLAKKLVPYQLFFLEDALSPEQMGWFSHFRNQTAVPLAMGELFNNPIEWNELISKRLIDYIRVHVSQIGGLTPARKLAALCENFGVRTAWHGPGDLSPVGVVAQLHLDLAIPNFGIQEFSGFSPEEEEVFPGCPQVRNGYLYANDKPGFGIDIDEKKAAMYPCSYREPGWLLARTTDGTAVRP